MLTCHTYKLHYWGKWCMTFWAKSIIPFWVTCSCKSLWATFWKWGVILRSVLLLLLSCILLRMLDIEGASDHLIATGCRTLTLSCSDTFLLDAAEEHWLTICSQSNSQKKNKYLNNATAINTVSTITSPKRPMRLYLWLNSDAVLYWNIFYNHYQCWPLTCSCAIIILSWSWWAKNSFISLWLYLNMVADVSFLGIKDFLPGC